MLKRAGETIDPAGAVVAIKGAAWPAPFASELEFNSPAHGTWNIVHTGMRVPGARQIYVCAGNCMRGVVLTAAEMNEADRFSFVIVEEENLLNGNLEDVTIDGVTDVIEKLDERPKAVLLFTVCLHHFLGCDLERVYGELESRFPDIFFVRCYMDPIMQKNGLTPDQKLRKAMYDPLPRLTEEEINNRAVSLLGSDFALDETSDIARILEANDFALRELPKCSTWEEYLNLAESGMFISCYPSGRYGAEEQAGRLGRKHLYLPVCFSYEEIIRHLEELAASLRQLRDKGGSENMKEISLLNYDAEIASCEAALAGALSEIGDMPVAIDCTFHPRPLGLARLLIAHGFSVNTVYLDGISPEEKDDFEWLRVHAPELVLSATIQVKMRVLPRHGEREVLAIGQKAAWFTGSRHFVNVVQGGGLYGFDGIRRLAGLMTEAIHEEKDTEDLVIRKGWGCESCI